MRTGILALLMCAVLWPRPATAVPPEELLAPATSRQPLAEAFPSPSDEPLRIAATLHPAQAPAGGQVTLRLAGTLAPGFYVYSGPTLPTPGPAPLRIAWSASPAAPAGPARTSPPLRIRDPVYGADADVYVDAFWIEQTLALPASLAPATHTLAGHVTYQVCDGQICSLTRRLPFAVPLTVK